MKVPSLGSQLSKATGVNALSEPMNLNPKGQKRHLISQGTPSPVPSTVALL